jgi:uncharacterized protein (TIGR00369 family)
VDEAAFQKARTVVYADSATVRDDVSSLDGKDAMQAVARGDIDPAPVARLVNATGIRLVEDERVVVTCEPHESLYNPAGTVQGGIIASWLDVAMGGAVRTVFPQGATLTTADMQVSFFAPVTVETGIVRCEGTIVHKGKTLVTAQARLTDAGGKLLAQASSTCVIVGN